MHLECNFLWNLGWQCLHPIAWEDIYTFILNLYVMGIVKVWVKVRDRFILNNSKGEKSMKCHDHVTVMDADPRSLLCLICLICLHALRFICSPDNSVYVTGCANTLKNMLMNLMHIHASIRRH